MNANELAEDLEGAKLVILRLNDMLLQQQAEIEALKDMLEEEGIGVSQKYLDERIAELRKAQEK